MSGLFHDIATPAFKHCVDFLNGDYINQESTEDLTSTIIKNSNEITKLLEKDNFKLNEVDDYHIYPIADNDTPQLAADRLEYSLSNALFTYKLADINTIREIYNNVNIQKNENGIDELGFKSEKITTNFVKITSKLSIIYRKDKTRYSMQFIADILKELNKDNLIKKEDLYTLKESDIIQIIENSKLKNVFDKWRNAKKILTSKTKPKNVYYIQQASKIRYIDPLVNGVRISKLNKEANKEIQKNLSYKMDNYVYLNLKF